MYVILHTNNNILKVLLNGYTFARDNGTLIDGTPCEKLHAVFRKNELALGYIINHPPKENPVPNLFPIEAPVDFENNLDILPYCPTWSDSKVIDNQVSVFLAIRDITDEELYFDYDMEGLKDSESERGLPGWYRSVDSDVYDI